MADLTRPNFGEAWASEGEKLSPGEAKLKLGWVQEMMTYQYENYLQARQDEAILYLLQKGVPEYSATQEYTANKSVVVYQGNLYMATSTVTGVLPTVTASWKRISPTVGANGAVSISSGGTGATTVAEARTNLGLGTASTANLPTTNGVVVRSADNTLISRLLTGTSGNISVTNPDGVAGNINIDVGTNVAQLDKDSSWTSKGGITLPKGSSSERGVEVPGKIRYNTELQKFEGYNGTDWNVLGATSEIEVTTLSGNGVDTDFVLNTEVFSVNATDVFINGVYQNKDTYTISGANITFSEVPTTGVDNIQVLSRRVVDLGVARASQVEVEDTSNLYSSTTVEGALREVGGKAKFIKNAILSYPDYASASAAAATLPDGQVMEIVADETRNGRRTRYAVTLGALEFRGGSGIWSVWDFGAVGDGVADDSAAFRAAAACEGQAVLIPWTPNGYKIDGTFETKCRFVGIGVPTIKLTVNGSTDRGFWIQSYGGIEGVRIERGVTAGAISGEFNNAIVIGEYATQGKPYHWCVVRDVRLVGVNAGFGRTTIMGIYGNSSDIELRNIYVEGFASYACMIHWGGDFDPAEPHGSPVTRSWHPRRIKIDGVTHRNPQPDSAAGSVYISAGHDITVIGLNSDGINTPITIACGDVGGLIAQGESAGRVLRGIKFINTAIRNYVERGVEIAGNSGTRAGGTWIMCNNNTQITFDGLIVTRGAKSTTGRSLNFRLATGVEITGLVMDHESGASPANLLSAGYIQSCDGVKVSGKTNVPFAWEILGSANVQINTQDECLRDDYPTDALGARVIGGQATATLAAAVNIGDTSIQVTALTIDLIKNSVVIIGGQKHLLRKAVQLSASTTTLEIYPARAAAASGASITVDRNTSGITLDGTAEGFYTGVRVMNSNSGHGEGVRIRKTYRRSGQYDANLQGARDVSFRGARFYDGGQLNTSSVSNIRMTNGCVGVDIDGCTFEDNVSGTTNIRNNVYLFGDSTAVSVRGNKFHAAQTAAINYFDPTGGTMRPVVSDNWYANGVTPLEPSAGVAKTMTIGEMQIGHGSAAPTTGIWRSGDFVFNQDPPAGGKLGWVCVTGGTPGVWKPAGSIDA